MELSHKFRLKNWLPNAQTRLITKYFKINYERLKTFKNSLGTKIVNDNCQSE